MADPLGLACPRSCAMCSQVTIVFLVLNTSSPTSARPLFRLVRALRWNWSSCNLAMHMRPAALGSPRSELLSNGNTLNCTDVHRL
ncbi:hypothetical protein FIBSPDRAFT_860262, partial [Athelia psychrophila]